MICTYKEMAVIHEYNKERDIPIYCSYVCFLKTGASVKILKEFSQKSSMLSSLNPDPENIMLPNARNCIYILIAEFYFHAKKNVQDTIYGRLKSVEKARKNFLFFAVFDRHCLKTQGQKAVPPETIVYHEIIMYLRSLENNRPLCHQLYFPQVPCLASQLENRANAASLCHCRPQEELSLRQPCMAGPGVLSQGEGREEGVPGCVKGRWWAFLGIDRARIQHLCWILAPFPHSLEQWLLSFAPLFEVTHIQIAPLGLLEFSLRSEGKPCLRLTHKHSKIVVDTTHSHQLACSSASQD